MDYMLITNDPKQAAMAAQAGVKRIMVDLEMIGKYDRQGHKDTHITTHTPDDVAKVKAAIQTVEGAQLLVRVNPCHEVSGEHIGTKAEVDHVIKHGADIIMLPMFRSVEEVQHTADIINGRAIFIPLFEHCDALNGMEEMCRECALDEVYLGLNDLHLSLNQSFLFETLLGNHVQHFCETAQRHGLPYGFGGIGSVHTESTDVPIPPSLIIKEHARLGSQRVILSRAFKQVATPEAFAQEIAALNDACSAAMKRTEAEIFADHQQLRAAIQGVVQKLAQPSHAS